MRSPRMAFVLHLGLAAAAADLERTALIDLAHATNLSGWAPPHCGERLATARTRGPVAHPMPCREDARRLSTRRHISVAGSRTRPCVRGSSSALTWAETCPGAPVLCVRPGGLRAVRTGHAHASYVVYVPLGAGQLAPGAPLWG